MRTLPFLVFFLIMASGAPAATPLVTKDEAKLIVSDMLEQAEPLHLELFDLDPSQEDVLLKGKIISIGNKLTVISTSYTQALERDLASGATMHPAGGKQSQLAPLWMCENAVSQLSKFAETLVDIDRQIQNPMYLARTYFGFLSNREDCRYQMGEDPPENLKQPSDLYREYLDRLKNTLLDMRKFDDPVFFKEARSDPAEWVLLQRKLFWTLQIGQRWPLYKLHSIMSNPRPYSPEKQKIVDRFRACQSLQTSFDRLFERFTASIFFNQPPLLDSRSLLKLLGEMNECEDLLADR